MKYEFHSIVIGAGSAGLSAASGLALFGAKAALIEKNKMGGECLNAGCVPSKTFLKSAHLAESIKKAKSFGLNANYSGADFKAVMARVKSVIGAIAENDSAEAFRKKGVEVIQGEASFIDNHTVEVGGRRITTKYIVIATGSEPAVPPIPGLNSVPFYTNKNIFDIDYLPRDLVVLGAGAIGLELSQGFRYLGSNVTVIDILPKLFAKDEPEAGAFLEKKLASDGINFYLSSKILDIKGGKGNVSVGIEKDGTRKEISGDCLLVALGRAPSKKIPGIEKTKVKTDKRGYIITDKHLRAGEKNIFACGDIVGPYQFTHMAGYQAKIVVQNIIFPFKAEMDYSCVPWTTFTTPEVAKTGYTEEQAKTLGLYKYSVVIPMSENDRARTESDEGFLKLVVEKAVNLSALRW